MNTRMLKDKIKSIFYSLTKSPGTARKKVPSFAIDNTTGIPKRKYLSYSHYLQHQKEKLVENIEAVKEYDLEYELIIHDRYKEIRNWQGITVLCLAARLGGEVRAFKSLGALAIGVDIEPGSSSLHVLYGDFHDIQFPDSSFDVLFCNAIDHVYDLDGFMKESCRVLKQDGLFIMELCTKKPGNYEAIDISDKVDVLLDKVKQYFCVLSISDVENMTSFVQWSGLLIQLKRKLDD